MKKKYIIVSIISVLLMMIGFSFAYFTSEVNGIGKEMNVSSKRLAIIFTDTKEISEVDINPGWSTSKTFTVENRSGEVFYYDINIDDLINTFVTTGYLQYKITSNDGGYNMDEYVDIPKSEEARREKLASNIEIENGKTHTYTIEFKYPNDPNVNQSDDMGKELSGSLSITESNIIIVKYKVNNVIQDTIPDKTEPYIVESVECSNNAKGVWNNLTEKVDLVGEVTQTVCIVSFKEGNTITVSSEHGEVVSPVSKVVGRIGSTTFEIEEKAGYSLDNAAIVCDNGAEGSIANKTITITNIKQNNTCKVITNPISIIVTYDVNGGSGVSPSSNTVTYGGKYKLPTTNPSRTGYTFAGWFTASSGGTEVTTNTNVTNASNHSIYAHWNINTYKVTVNVTNGSVTTTNPLTINHGSSGTFTIRANTGYKLDGATVSGTGCSYNQNGTLTVSNVTSVRTCTITLAKSRVTFNVVSKTDPDREFSASPTSACYYENIWSPDGLQRNTFTYVGTDKNYANCTIIKSQCTTNISWMMKTSGRWGCLHWARVADRETGTHERCPNSATQPSSECFQTGVSNIDCTITIECDA